MVTLTAPTTPSSPILPSDTSRLDSVAKAARKARAIAIDARTAMALKRRRKVTFIDLRDWEVLDRTSWIEGSLHCPPGEFATLIDPSSPLHGRLFEPGCVFIFYGGPKASPLAAARKARKLGLEAMALRGGLRAWRDAGGRTAGHPDSAFPALRASIRVAYRFTMSGARRRVTQVKRRLGMASR